MMGVSMTTTTESLGEGLDLLVDAITEPSFDAEDLELERCRNITDAGLAHLAAAPVRAIIPGSGRNDAPHV